MKSYVIIGNGTAAAGCIEGIRSVDSEGAITVISMEEHPVYCRPLISYYLEKKTDLDKIGYREEDFYERNGCRVIYGARADRIDTENKRVILNDLREIPYTEVCVAAGSSPFTPPFSGLEKVARQCNFMTIDDALRLESMVSKNTRVLIIGAGLIGLKCAEGLCSIAGSIAVTDIADRVLSSILDSECAALMQEELEAHGVEFLLSDSVECFDEGSARMKSGRVVPFDVLVLAVGVRANTSLVKEAGGEVGRGIIVNDKAETSLASVYAAGDCTQSLDISSGTSKVMAIMPNAYMQGHCAGVNMAGGSEVFDNAIPMNSIGFFSIHAMSAGTCEGEIYEQKAERSLRRLFVKDDLLKGFMLIGSTDRAGIYTSMIREKTPLSSVDFDLLQKAASSAAFSSQKRRNMFGGVV